MNLFSSDKSSVISSLIDQILKTVDSGDESIALHTRIRIAIKETVYKYPTFATHVNKCKFLYTGKIFCFLHSPGLEVVLVVMSRLVANEKDFHKKCDVKSKAFVEAAKQIQQKYAECRASFDSDDKTQFIAVSTHFGAKVLSILQKMFGDLKLEIRPEGLSQPATLSDSKVYRPVGVDLDWVLANASNSLSSMTIESRSGLAKFRTDKGDLSIGEDFNPNLFASVLYFAYEHSGSCSFSLEPAEPLNPAGPFQKKIYYPSEMEGTVLGGAMWLADWKLKQLDQGQWYVDDLKTRVPITDIYPGIHCAYDFLPPDSLDAAKQQFWRMWFVFESIHLDVAKINTSLTLKATDVRIRIKAMKMGLEKSGLVDQETADDDPSRKFADYITENFDKIYPKVPAFKVLRDIAIMKGFADYIRDEMKVPKALIKTDELKDIGKWNDDYPPSRVPRISTQKTRSLNDYQNITISISGGVNLGKAEIISQSNDTLTSITTEDEADILSAIATEDEAAQILAESLSPIENDQVRREIEKELDQLHKQEMLARTIVVQKHAEEESEEDLTLFRVFQPTMCSVSNCPNTITYNMRYFDGVYDPQWKHQTSNWCTHEGNVYCLEHHPLHCNAEHCLVEPPVVKPGKSYLKWDNRIVFHCECYEREDKAKLLERFPSPE